MNSSKKKIYALAGLFGLVLAMAAAPFLATTVPVRILGPFYNTPQAFDSLTGGQVGGKVVYALAGDTCRIGQVVYFSAKNTVKPSATLADYNQIAGVVVGGARTNMQASVSKADTSTLAATANQRVIILKQGRFWLLDSAGGDSPGLQMRPSGTAGRVAVRLAAIDSLRRNFAKLVDSMVGGTATLADINIP